MPSKKKRYNARFPPARIKKIMQKDEEVGKVAQAVPVIIAKALESFAEQLLTTSSEVTRSRNARTLTPHHIKTAIFNKAEFQFLRELAQTIPDVNNPMDEDVQQLQNNMNNTIVEDNGNNNHMVNCIYSSNNTNNNNINNCNNNNNPMLVASTSNRGHKPSPTATMTTSPFSSPQPSTSQHHQTSNNIIHENNVPIRTRGRPRKRPLIEEPCLSTFSSSNSNTLKAAVELSTLQSGSKALEQPNKNSRVQTNNNFNDNCKTKTNQQQAKQRGKRPKRRKSSGDDEDSTAEDDADEVDDDNNEDDDDDEDTVEDEDDDDATEDEEYEEEIMDQWIENETIGGGGGGVLSSSTSINNNNKKTFNLTKCSSFTRMTTSTNQMTANFGASITNEQTIVNKEDDYDDY